MSRAYSLQDLEVFRQVAELAGMSKAARHLNMTTAAVSAAIKRLEMALGVSLLERTTRSLRLSPAGEAFMPHLHQVLAGLDMAESELRNLQTLAAGDIRIGMPSDLGRHRFTALLDSFQELNPQINFIVHLSDYIQDLYRENLDIVIRYGEQKDSGLIARKLADNRRVLVASPDYLARHPLYRLEDLCTHNCLLFYLNDRPYDKWSFWVEGREQVIPVSGNRSSQDGELVKRWVIASKGIAYKSWLDVEQELAAGTLVEPLAGQYQGQWAPVYAVYKERKYQAYRITALLQHLEQEMTGAMTAPERS